MSFEELIQPSACITGDGPNSKLALGGCYRHVPKFRVCPWPCAMAPRAVWRVAQLFRKMALSHVRRLLGFRKLEWLSHAPCHHVRLLQHQCRMFRPAGRPASAWLNRESAHVLTSLNSLQASLIRIS